MELYFSPLACSLATRIALYEANADAQFIEVDTKSKQLRDGSDFYPLNPLGQVPVLRTDEGWLLKENTAILPYVADAFPAAALAPAAGTAERAKLQEWLGFISTELHKGVFVPLLDPHASADVRAYTQNNVALRLNVLEQHLGEREFLLDHFTVADAYLVTVLNWAQYGGVDLAEWPAVAAYYKRTALRPPVARALREEIALFGEQQARRQARAS
ncbi:glutathione S-transferase C-terminal domain-containing protein [Paraburkholderia bryophila]|uniref:glutathione S-transferase C-terminal domain-containing protein n=1 Tax=Paraburkholderia bryophila TaxID=420952 RepID=UPI00234B3691|nr:glutathione S-transferase C-terminal domain-containing protein [Paraburkholderia bryophila]WCM23112.1 glutathione S-transferase C-terminal domain-containing protein [Paraburkholderia bryophila]